MNYFSAGRYYTKEQASAMGKASQKVQALRRLSSADYAPIPVRSGLQLAVIVLDCRTPVIQESSLLLFQANEYQNRYRWMHNMEKQEGLLGWHDAMSKMSSGVRPLLIPD
jgi:hypothetical protein